MHCACYHCFYFHKFIPVLERNMINALLRNLCLSTTDNIIILVMQLRPRRLCHVLFLCQSHSANTNICHIYCSRRCELFFLCLRLCLSSRDKLKAFVDKLCPMWMSSCIFSEQMTSNHKFFMSKLITIECTLTIEHSLTEEHFANTD